MSEITITRDDKTALLFGASGMVGKNCLNYLLSNSAYEKVVIFVRKALNIANDKLEQVVLDFNKLEDFVHKIKGDDMFISLGTTMAKAGSKDAFYAVDFDLVTKIAQIGSDNGVGQCLIVSSVGANADSIFYYNRVKGEVEDKVKDLKFWSIHIFQPSVLLGERPENRFGERIAGRIGKVLDSISGGMLMKYKPVEAEVVAKAMVNAAQHLKDGVFVYPSHYLQKLADEEDELRNKLSK